MRIISGICRGRPLAGIGKGDKGAHLRPTTDRVRESLFSILQGGRFDDPITDARVLDLFAGTGALGLEALSRGAAQCCFVDDGRISTRLIRDNIGRCGFGKQAKLIARDATRLPVNDQDPHNLVFLDPPYGSDLGPRALVNAAKAGWFANGTLIVFEDDTTHEAPAGFTLLEARRFGATHVSFMRFD